MKKENEEKIINKLRKIKWLVKVSKWVYELDKKIMGISFQRYKRRTVSKKR